ncbi:hypothetical protein V2H45_10685 [Tumidithrix elongata RA019]|uniref:DUF7925 domain-containing protein n=1 Tax=Tumidithrix elongata BACA0141 TaxID=2716417 RepID=A0AAW9PXT0_9CYAN|nr:hypothetical protein [Tumidithrix elongata RA019]
MSERKNIAKSSQGKSLGAKTIKHHKRGSIFKRFVLASLTMGGLGQIISLSAIAQLTPAGTPIDNRATGSYVDPNNPGNVINTTSNTVRVTTAPVAGITNTNLAFTDVNGGNVSPNDVLNFDFIVTNTGNFPSTLNLPSTANIATQNFTITGYQADLDNNGTFETIIPLNTAFPTPATIPAGQAINVRVIGTVSPTALVNDPVSVSLGNTGPNDNSPNTQNRPDTNGTGFDPTPPINDDNATNPNDVRTTGNDPVSGLAPVNGQREAAAIRSVPVGSSVQNIALATVLKTRSNYVPNTPVTTDDQITYRLDMRVESASPVPNFTPTSLQGTLISLEGAAQTRVLVSDAIPAGTSFVAGSAIAPPGWTIVYSTSPTTSLPIGAVGVAANWTATPPAPAAITRIGMVFTGNLAPGYTTVPTASGLTFTVVTSGLAPAGGTIANIAQVFGQTLGDPTNRIIYDESGDQFPNNFINGTTPPTPQGSLYGPIPTQGTAPNPATDPTGAANGVANPAVHGTDNNNNNTGTEPAGGVGGTAASGGEDNVITITTATNITNGPNGQAPGVGPTNNTDDFTNLSTPIAAGLNPGATIDPPAVVFPNTFQNTGAGNLDRVGLVPLPPNAANAANPTGRQAGDMPDGTTVRIQVPAVGANPAQDVTYTYNAGVYTQTAGAPVVLNGIAPNQTVNYTVTVDLPAGTQQSSDRFIALGSNTNAGDRSGYSVPIVAFADNNNNGFDNDPISNTTIDRVYTGYMNLLKESRILQGTGPAVGGANGTFSTANKVAAQGNIIEYRLSYTNFSTPATAGSSGNGTLNASNFVVNDDGTVAPNNWSGLTTHNFGTTATLGTLQFFNGAAPIVGGDPASGIAVTRYQNTVGTVVPAPNPATPSGTFTFRRTAN